jgi:hypothetical protein
MNTLVQRAINILKTPRTEWPVIAAEQATPKSIYIPYALALAAIGPLAFLLGGGGFLRLSSAFLLRTAIWQYVASLVGVALFAFVIDWLAPRFGATKNYVQALKTTVYAATAAWVAGIGALLGGLGTLLMLAGGIYSIYLVYTGLPHTMKAPAEKATAYTAVSIIACFVAGLVLSLVGGALGLTGGAMGLAGGYASQASTQVFDPDSTMGRLEQAGRAMEQAEREGKTQDPASTMGAVMGALAGGATHEALPADTLKGFLPATLAGLPRGDVAAERNGAMGLQIAQVEAEYRSDARELELEIIDTGGAAGLLSLAGWAQLENSRESGGRSERTGREGDRIVHEVWDSGSQHGEYAVILGQRFVVKVEGKAASLDELKSTLREIDLAKLESLRNEGVKAGG